MKRTGIHRAAALTLVTLLASGQAVKNVIAQTMEQNIATSGRNDDTSFCGDQQIRLGIHDGLGINGWSKTSMAAVRSEAAKCENVVQIARSGQGDLQKAIADVNGLVAQGVDALVIIPDWGQAQLPSIRNATRAGVKVVPWAANPGGTPGKDFVDYVDWDPADAGKTLGQWTAEAVQGEGNVVFLGGPAGNPVTASVFSGVKEALAEFPEIKLLTGESDWPVTNWDAAQTQKTMVALLAKYPEIDAVINDGDGFSGLGVIRAFESAGRPLVPYAVFENNQLSCDFAGLKEKYPDFEIGTISARNWVGRIAVRKAIATAAGIANDEPSSYKLPIFEDTISDPATKCDPSLPPDGSVSANLSAEELATYGQLN